MTEKRPHPGPITRRHFIGSAAATATALGVSATGLSRLGSAQGKPPQDIDATVVVYPTGRYPEDFLEVDAAVNGGQGPSGTVYPGGGTICLKATISDGVTPMYFNFGDDVLRQRTVNATKDVVIVGESLQEPWVPFDLFPNGELPDLEAYPLDRTIIYGGKRTLGCASTNPTPTRLTIRNIYFAYPILAAAQVAKSAGFEVSDCVVYDVRMGDTGAGFSTAMGFETTGLGQRAPELFGELRITRNRIKRQRPTLSPKNFEATCCGIVLQGGATYSAFVPMNAVITSNEIAQFTFVGVATDFTSGSVIIEDNTISECGFGPNAVSAGIGVRNAIGPVLVEHNTVVGGNAGGNASLPSKNGISIAGTVGAVVKSNVIGGGVALHGILLTTATRREAPGAPLVSHYATDNRVLENNLVELSAGVAQELLNQGCGSNDFKNNYLGAVLTGGSAGILIGSDRNSFVNERFWADYAGAPLLPWLWLKPGTTDNSVAALRDGRNPDGLAVCSQIRDEGINFVYGIERCAGPGD